MGSDIVLTGATANNLLSIQNTQSLVDRTTVRLSTGLAVNSALDNPSSFFGARALQSRASDLQRLVDGISQAIRAVQQANSGVEALSQLSQQAQSIAQSASDTISASTRIAGIEGNRDLSSVSDLTSLNGISAGDQIALSTNLLKTVNITPPTLSVTITAGMSGSQLVKAIDDLRVGLFVNASMTEDGFLRFETGEANLPIGVNFVANTSNDTNNLNLARALGFGEQAQLRGDGLGNNEVQFVLSATSILSSFSLFDIATNEPATRNDTLVSLEGPNDSRIFLNLDSPNDLYEIGVNNDVSDTIALTSTLTVGGFIDSINSSPILGEFLKADFDDETSRITIEAIDFSVESIQTSLTSDGLAAAFFGFNISPEIYGTAADQDSIYLGTFDDETLDSIRILENDYNNVLTSITDITQDSSFQGVNLLAGDRLEVFFNENLSSSLNVDGINFRADNLGLTEANFRTIDTIETALAEAQNALSAVRQFGTRLSNNLSIIETREGFTNVTINSLLAGADDLTQTDVNEEGAVLLALQTRQELATTALSLGVQQQENILTLF